MNWKDLANKNNYDDETLTLLQISLDFLQMYFGYNEETANKNMADFLEVYSKDFDEDQLHRESSYRIAAIVHYLVGLKGPRNELQKWLVENINNKKTPYEALEYFRKHYFESN